MSMYFDLLVSIADPWMDDLSDAELVRYARSCRNTLEHPGTYGVTSNVDVLAAEVAYDRALLRLCNRKSIPVDLKSFEFRAAARERMESALRSNGIGLDVGDARN